MAAARGRAGQSAEEAGAAAAGVGAGVDEDESADAAVDDVDVVDELGVVLLLPPRLSVL